MGRLFLVLGLCVAALGFSLHDLNLDNAGNVVAEAFRTRKLLESETVKIAQHFKLQDATTCGRAWQTLAGMLQNSTDPCNVGLLVLQSSLRNATWTNGGTAAYLNNFCDFSFNGLPTCLQKWQAAYQNLTAECSGFNTQTPLGGGYLANMTDFVARTVNTLVQAMCMKDSTLPYDAPQVSDPLNSSQTIAQNHYDFTYCWVHFTNLVGTNISTANNTVLDGVCTPCAKNISRWLIKNAPNQLAVGARQALSFCDKNPDVDGAVGYCANKVRALQMKNMDPTWVATLKTNPTPENLAYLCHPCVKWGIRLALRLQNLLQDIKSAGFVAAVRDDLQKTASGLSVSCVIHPNGKYCAVLLAPYLSNTTNFLTKFQPCLAKQTCTSDPHDKCQLAVFDLWRLIGCCLATLQNSLNLDPQGQAYAPIVTKILASCKLGAPGAVPSTCAQKKNIVTFPLKNVAQAYVLALGMDKLKLLFAQSIGIDVLNIVDVNCTEAANKSTSCVVQFFPDDTASAITFVTDFNFNQANGALYLPEFDIASLENSSANGGARLTTTDDAYDAASFSATSVDSCLNGTSPAKYTFDPTTQQCVGICEDKMKDGDESDVDCGGTGCARCPLGSQCVTDLDCDPSIPNLVCKQNCSGTAGSCTYVCASGFATALMANPLTVLAGLLVTMLLM